MKYRHKPTIVAAIQFDARDPNCDKHPGIFWDTEIMRYYAVTIHGDKAYLCTGDYVIAEPDGKHFYPVKPDIFERDYEPVEG